MLMILLIITIVGSVVLYELINLIVLEISESTIWYRIQQILAYMIALEFAIVPFLHYDVITLVICAISSAHFICDSIIYYNQAKAIDDFYSDEDENEEEK